MTAGFGHLQSIRDTTKGSFTSMLGNQQILEQTKEQIVMNNVSFKLNKFGEQQISVDFDEERVLLQKL